jgi:hypothetical protein
MWDDERFRELTPAPPNAQTLWQRLLTGPELGCIPGLYTARLGGLADALGWSADDVRQKWEEIETRGMAFADWRAGLVWVPNAIVHNEPNSVNTILGWRLALRELPECELKRQAVAAIKEQCRSMGPAWLSAFDSITNEQKPRSAADKKPSRMPRGKPSCVPSGKPSEMPSPMASETASVGPSDTQEQEQDSEDKISPDTPPDLDLDPDHDPISASSEDLTGSARARTSEPSIRAQIDPCLRSLSAPHPDELWIFEQWAKTFDKTNVVFDSGRASCLAYRRLAGMTREDAAAALRGAAANDFVMGRKTGKRNDRLLHIFGDQERFEEYRDEGYALLKACAPNLRAARSQEAQRKHDAWKLEQERKATEEATASLAARGINPDKLTAQDLRKLVANIG